MCVCVCVCVCEGVCVCVCVCVCWHFVCLFSGQLEAFIYVSHTNCSRYFYDLVKI